MARTFTHYTWGEYDANNEAGLASTVDWDSYPTADGADWDELMRDAGWQGCEQTGVGVLTEPWNGHPAGAWIVSDETIPGYPFAVSTRGD